MDQVFSSGYCLRSQSYTRVAMLESYPGFCLETEKKKKRLRGKWKAHKNFMNLICCGLIPKGMLFLTFICLLESLQASSYQELKQRCEWIHQSIILLFAAWSMTLRWWAWGWGMPRMWHTGGFLIVSREQQRWRRVCWLSSREFRYSESKNHTAYFIIW